MVKKLGFIFFIVFILLSCKQEPVSLLSRLEELPGVTVTEITPPEGYLQAFEIQVTQFIDHQNPAQGSFTQQIFLSHIDETRPMVLETSGYGVSRNYIRELTTLLDANQIRVTHRFFPNAKPYPLNWQYLTIRQSAGDFHQIVDLFKRIYKGKWVNTGVSKGGMTVLFHRRFFPNDVDVTVAYVAPLMFDTEDLRFEKFLLEEVGDETCRNKIKEFQEMLLTNSQALLPYVSSYAQDNGLTFSIGEAAALEYSIIEYLFAFWQYGDGDCSKIPGPDASLDEMFSHLVELSPLTYYSDSGIEYFEPLFYQAYTELGYCTYVTEHLKDLLVVLNEPTYRSFAPRDVELNFNPEVMQDVNNWLQNEGNNIIYIYGAIDPWTAAAVELTGYTNALKIVQPGGNHNVRIMDLDEQDTVIQTLEQWLDLDIQTTGKTFTQIDIRSEIEHQLTGESEHNNR
jgi:hypothetical protein